MALTTYSELKSSVKSWLNRSDLDALIPDFITLAEKRINRTFLPRSQETESELVTVPGSRFVLLPDGVINPVGLWLKAYLPREKLTQVLPAELPVKTNVSGYPEFWCIDGSNIAFDKLALGAYTFDFRYTVTFALSDSVPTNYVLESCPDLYLFGAMVEAYGFMQDTDSAAVWELRYRQSLLDASSNENDTRATAIMTTDLVAHSRNGRFNILRGY